MLGKKEIKIHQLRVKFHPHIHGMQIYRLRGAAMPWAGRVEARIGGDGVQSATLSGTEWTATLCAAVSASERPNPRSTGRSMGEASARST